MSISFTPRKLSVQLAIFPLLLSAPSFASHHDHHDDKDGHAIVRDVESQEHESSSMKIRMKSIARFRKATFALFLICMKQWRMICMGVLLR